MNRWGRGFFLFHFWSRLDLRPDICLRQCRGPAASPLRGLWTTALRTVGKSQCQAGKARPPGTKLGLPGSTKAGVGAQYEKSRKVESAQRRNTHDVRRNINSKKKAHATESKERNKHSHTTERRNRYEGVCVCVCVFFFLFVLFVFAFFCNLCF